VVKYLKLNWKGEEGWEGRYFWKTDWEGKRPPGIRKVILIRGWWDKGQGDRVN